MTAGGEKMSGPLLVLLGLTAAVGAVPAKTTRYWDCCKPSCAWDSNANKGGVMRVDAPVHSCGLDGAPLADGDAKNICAGGGSNSGPAYMCTNQLPFEVTADVAYGYAAANLECSVCYELAFESSTVLAGKRMVVQVVNSGDDLGAVHFDLQIPGGGFGIFNGCTGQSVNGPGQFSSTTEAQWGKRYGGVNSLSECGNLPSELQAGCNFRFGWFKNADNPGAQATRVKCPDSLVAASGSRRLDDDQFPDPAGNGAPVPPTPMLPPPSGPAPVPPTTCPGASSNCDCGWTNNGANCGSDDGSECFCRCCCPTKNSCNWQNGGGGGGGGGGAGGGSNCAMPAGVPSDPPAKNNRNFIDCHGKLTLGGPSGLQLVDESGAAVQLMGMSSHGLHWFPNCYTKEAIQHLTENWGINLFRAAMYVGEGGYASNPSVKQTVKDIVQWCKELGIYVMIDWHMLNPGNPNDGTYSGAQAFFEEMATLYKNEKHVLYELANEPNGVQWPAVKSYHNKIIAAIRRIDTETIIICGTPTWSQEIDKAAADPVDQPRNVMYTFHFYAGSHQGLLANVETYASQIPIFVTEWGTSMASGDGGPYLPETKKFLDTFNSAGSLGISISWAQWSYADKNEVSAALNPGACSSKSWDDTSCSGTFLKNYIKANAPTCGNKPPITSVPGLTPAPATDSPPMTPAPATDVPPQSNCPGSSPNCDCGWTNNGANCGTDDGSECFCRCCCPSTNKCNWQNGGGGGGGGGGSNCAMPAGVPSDPPAKNNRNFIDCHGKLTLGGPSGLQLVDESGAAVQLMGMSSHGLHWFPNCYTKEAIQHLTENWGINLFRAAMYVGEGGYASNPSVKQTVKDIVQWCKELGIYVMIDWHMLNPGNPNDGTYSGAQAFFEEMATLYKNEKHVLYELANEPNGVQWPAVKSYHNKIIAAIRRIDTETIIICGTPTWSQEIDKAAADPVDQPRNVMYTFHFYAGSHQGLLANVETYASQIPIFVTEWGTSMASGDGGPYLPETKKFLDTFNSAGSLGISISWAQWSYADKNEVSAALNPGACSSKSWDDTSCSGTFLKNYIKANAPTCGNKPPITSVPGLTPAPATDSPPMTPAPATDVPPQSNCPGSSPNCDCGWTNNGANCGTDDGSECFCRCCCPSTNKCNWQNGGGGGGGGGGSNCAMPAGVPSDPPAKNNRNFIDCHGKLTLGGPSGLQLVDESGAAVQLMGMSSHGLHWFPNCYTKEAIQHLTENWGINLFRAAMYVGEGGYASNPSVKQTVKDIVQWCKELGIYVMIDWHMLNPGNPNDGTYSGAQAFFEEMATLYKNEKHVLYELANEPNGVQWPAVKSYHNKIIAAIRRIDTETIIICGTPTWSQEIDKAAADPVDQPRNVMYTFHFYAGSHQGLLANVETYASQIPIFVTEWGTSMASGDGGPYLPETKKFLDTFNSAGSLGISISWAQWSYADKNEVSAALNPGACSSKSWDDTSCSGTFLKNYIKANAPTCGNKPPITSVPGLTPAPATDSPPMTPAPATDVPPQSNCPGSSPNCDCGWTNNGANCGTDDGSECFCRCCCPSTNKCNWQNGGGGGGGGGGSNCAMPAGVPSDPPAKNNRNFIDCHGKLTLGGPSGLQLVDESGAAVQLMGMSSHGLHWFPNCYTKEAIQHLTENWGINLFRAAMYVGEGGYASNPSVKQTVKDIVQWCKELGIYVMIDWHMLNPGNPNDGTYSGAQAFFEEMATLYKNEKHVLYELANEPNGVQWPAVKSYHNKIIAAIRRIDTETIIICGTPTWSQEIDKAAADPVDQPRNVMYTFHFYAGSHQGLLANVETYASQIPIFVTEWGTSMASGDGGPYLPETKKFLDTFNSAGSLGISISWAQWSYADKNEVSAALNPGACSSKSWDDTSCSGTFLKNYIKANAPTCGNTPSVTSAPDTTAPATDVPKTSAPSTDAPATAVPKTSVPKTDAPETDAPATDAPRTSAPETDAPETMAPKTNAPATDAPATKPGQTRAPATDAPATDAPKTNAPVTDAPETMAPKTNAPATDAPATKPGQTRAPATDAPATDAPKTNAPETDAPETMAPKTNAPATDAPATDAPATDAPVPKTDAPATTAPETKAPATGAPDTDAPVRTDAPATDAPSTQCKMYDACLNNPDCCPSGTQCFKNNDWYAQCLTKCPKGWDCDVLSGGVPPPAPTLPTHGLCSKTIKKHGACTAAPYCCEGSLTCFEQSGWYAQCLDVCPGDGWSCRDLGKTPRDPRGLGAATGTAPRCNCPSWQKADTYCSSMQGGGDQCQDIPQSGVCDPSTEYKCFGTSAAAEEARQLMTFVLSNGVANFNRATFEQMVKDGLEDSAATILVKYLCPASECPFGNCADPFGAASKCIDVYDLSGRAGAVLGGEDGGAVVGVEVQSEKKQNLYGAFDKKELDGVVSMNEWWVEGGYDAGSKGKKDNSSSSSSNLAAIIGGTLGGLLCMGGLVAAAMLVRAKGRKAEEEAPMSMQELEDQKALRSTTANAVEFHSI